MSLLSANEVLTLVEAAGIPAGYRSDLIIEAKGVEWITKLIEHSYAKGHADAKHNMLSTKPTVQKLMDLARAFRSASSGDLYDRLYKELQDAIYGALYPTSAYALPERPRSIFCTKCGASSPTQAKLGTTPECSNIKCGYSAFVIEDGYEARHLHDAYNAGQLSFAKDAGRYKRLRAVGGQMWHDVTDPKNPIKAINEYYDTAVDAYYPEDPK